MEKKIECFFLFVHLLNPIFIYFFNNNPFNFKVEAKNLFVFGLVL
jgi:hypothetical protein